MTGFPVPHLWVREFRGMRALGIACVAVLPCVVVVCVVRGQMLVAVMAGLLACGFVAAVAAQWRSWVIAEREVPVGGLRIADGELKAAIDPTLWTLHVACLVSAVVAMVLVVVLQARGTFPQDSGGFVEAVLCGALFVYQAKKLIRMGSRDSLVVSVDGITARSLEGGPIRLDWGAIAEAVPCERTANSVTVAVGWGPKAPRIPVDELAIGAPAAYWLLDFYARHPSLRDELGDARVLRRLRDGSLIESPCRHV